MNTKEIIHGLEKIIKGVYRHRLIEYREILEEAIKFLKREQKFKEELIQFLEKENPYPEDVFLPIEKEDFNKINDLIKKEMGYSIDRLSGNMGRKLYKSIIEILKEVIKC